MGLSFSCTTTSSTCKTELEGYNVVVVDLINVGFTEVVPIKKDTKHALLLPICSDLNGPDRYKSDWCFVLVCVTWPRIAFRFSASSITVILISPSLLQVEVLVAFPKNQKNRFRWSSLCYDPSRFAGHKTSSIYLHSDGPFLLSSYHVDQARNPCESEIKQ